MRATIESIFVTASAGQPMRKTENARAEAGRGLEGDRYYENAGHWSEKDPCEVTLIEREELERIARDAGISVLNGEHRRNLVTNGIHVKELEGKRFRVGTAILEYVKPRPPCDYLESLTEQGIKKQLAQCGGICARVIASGCISVKDRIEILK